MLKVDRAAFEQRPDAYLEQARLQPLTIVAEGGAALVQYRDKRASPTERETMRKLCIEALGAHIGLKWPNDLWLLGDDRKLGGILIEVAPLHGAGPGDAVPVHLLDQPFGGDRFGAV